MMIFEISIFAKVRRLISNRAYSDCPRLAAFLKTLFKIEENLNTRNIGRVEWYTVVFRIKKRIKCGIAIATFQSNCLF